MGYTANVLKKEKEKLEKKLRRLRKKEKEYLYSSSRSIRLAKVFFAVGNKRILKDINAKQRLIFLEKLEKLINKYRKMNKNFYKEHNKIVNEIIDVESKIQELTIFYFRSVI